MSSPSERVQSEIDAANASGRKPVVFIHGLWLLADSWADWRPVFDEAGYATVALDWPDDPETTRSSTRTPRGVRAQEGRCHRRSPRDGGRRARRSGRRWSGIRSAACSRRSWPGGDCRPLRWRSIPHRSKASCPSRSPRSRPQCGVEEPRQPRALRAAHLRPVPLRLRQRGRRGRSAPVVRPVLRARCRAPRCSKRRRPTSTRGPR